MLAPYAGLAWISAETGAFAESGGAQSALSGSGGSNNVGYVFAGVRVPPEPVSLGDFNLTPRINLGWQHALSGTRPADMVQFIATSQAFAVAGTSLVNDAALVQLGVDAALAPDARLSFFYDATLSNRMQNQALRLEFAWHL